MRSFFGVIFGLIGMLAGFVIQVAIGTAVVIWAAGFFSQAHAGTPTHPTNDEAEILWDTANDYCRGNSGTNPDTDMWCTVREDIGVIMENRGLCYNPHSKVAWHKMPKGMKECPNG